MAEQTISTTTYFLVFSALLGLTGLTVWAAFWPLGPFADPVALAIAATKTALVVLFFMHAIHSEKLVLATIATGLIWLLILISLTMSDVLTRDWLPGGTLG